MIREVMARKALATRDLWLANINLLGYGYRVRYLMNCIVYRDMFRNHIYIYIYILWSYFQACS
jgi:hypothetical protein